jgi:hypothetical protein
MFDAPMTPAERQQRRRDRLKADRKARLNAAVADVLQDWRDRAAKEARRKIRLVDGGGS